MGFKGIRKRDAASWGPQGFRVLNPVDHPNVALGEGIRQEERRKWKGGIWRGKIGEG